MGIEPSGPRSASAGELTGRPRVAVAAFCIGFGLFICAAGLRWVDVKPSPGVPHWILGLAGVVFLLAGIAIALPRPPSRWHDVIGALLFTVFATMGLWIGFGPGERRFGGGLSAGGLAVHGAGSSSVGRFVFGGMGVLVLLIALVAWRRVFRRRPEASEEPTRPAP